MLIKYTLLPCNGCLQVKCSSDLTSDTTPDPYHWIHQSLCKKGMSLTCVVDSISHLIAADAASLLSVIMLKNALQRKRSCKSVPYVCAMFQKVENQKTPNLPLFDLIPQVSKLLQIKSSSAVHLNKYN